MRTWVALSFVCLACSGDPPAPGGGTGGSGSGPVCQGEAGTSDVTLVFTASYGECAGYCRHTLTLLSDGAFVILHESAAGNPAVKTVFDIAASSVARIRTEAQAAVTPVWEAQYGCPDCADQGAYDLTVTTGARSQHTRLDPLNHPTSFDVLLPDLKQLLDSHPASLAGQEQCNVECFAPVTCHHCTCDGPVTTVGCCPCGVAETSCL